MTTRSPAQQQQLEQLYRDHHSWLSGFLQRRLGCSHSAADLLQDTYLRLLTRGRLPEHAHSRGYLTRIAKGLVIDLYRRRRVEQAYLDDYKANAETNLLAIYNLPLSWGSVTTYDAYVSFQPRDDITLELVGSNLTDEYYIDPTTRSAVAAPGRALKLSLTAQF